MDVPAFARQLKQKNGHSEVWWDSSPTAYATFRQKLISKYPDMSESIGSLLPDHFANSVAGVSGATTNPTLITQAVLQNAPTWREYLSSLPAYWSGADKALRVYDQVIIEGAEQLRPLWTSSHHGHGWLSAQVEGGEGVSDSAIVARGLHLASLAPNIMIKVPGSEQGYRAIEQLVAQGCSVNNTFCFTVSQAAACLRAIDTGRQQARAKGVNVEQARYVISFMIGRLGCETEFERQANQRNLCLTAADRRWAEIAVYLAMQTLLRRWQTPARLLLCSLKVDTDVKGHEHCWHLQRTGAGADTTLYTLTPTIIEFLIRRQQQMEPVTPADAEVHPPKRVLNRLSAIPYFNQAYFEGDLAPSGFASHPAFMTASEDARKGQQRLIAFVNQATSRAHRPLPQASTPVAMGRYS